MTSQHNSFTMIQKQCLERQENCNHDGKGSHFYTYANGSCDEFCNGCGKCLS